MGSEVDDLRSSILKGHLKPLHDSEHELVFHQHTVGSGELLIEQGLTYLASSAAVHGLCKDT